jgi:hypothetical protein
MAVLMAKAKEFVAEYVYHALQESRQVTSPFIDHKWCVGFCKKNGMSLKKPNKRWSLPYWLRKERMIGFWLNAVRLNRWVYLHKKYIPRWEVMDQKPFYRSDSGSKDCKTLGWANAETPVAEIPSHSRERVSVCTTVTDEVSRIADGLSTEITMKGTEQMAALMQKWLDEIRADGSLGPLTNVTVHATTSASYTGGDVEQYMHRHLNNNGPTDRWRVFSIDAADATEAIRFRLRKICWENGYVGPNVCPPGITGDLQGIAPLRHSICFAAAFLIQATGVTTHDTTATHITSHVLM